MQSNSDTNNSVAAAMVAALVTRRPASVNENPSHNAMRVYLDKLRELVPHCPKNRSVSKLELIQHVIDYINDLQDTLQNDADPDSPPASPSINPLSFTEAFSHLSFSENGSLRGTKPTTAALSSSYEDYPTGYTTTTYTSDGSSDYDSRGSSPINNSDTDYSGDECPNPHPLHHHHHHRQPLPPQQHYTGPFYTNSLTLQVSSTAASSPFSPSPAPSNNDPRRFFRKGYGLPAHLSG